MNLYTFYQGSKMTDSTYLERFQMVAAVIEQLGGSIREKKNPCIPQTGIQFFP